jgi:hypothetical protein
MLKYGKEYVKQSMEEYQRKITQQLERSLRRKAAALGYVLVRHARARTAPRLGLGIERRPQSRRQVFNRRKLTSNHHHSNRLGVRGKLVQITRITRRTLNVRLSGERQFMGRFLFCSWHLWALGHSKNPAGVFRLQPFDPQGNALAFVGRQCRWR